MSDRPPEPGTDEYRDNTTAGTWEVGKPNDPSDDREDDDARTD